MPEHHGEALEEFLRMNRINRTVLIGKLDVARGTFYSWLKSRTLEKDVLDVLKKEIGFVPKSLSRVGELRVEQPYNSRHQSIQTVNEGAPYSQLDYLIMENELLKKSVQQRDTTIEQKDKMIESLTKTLEMLYEQLSKTNESKSTNKPNTR